MPFCPECHLEYRVGFTACSDCGVPLVGAPPHHTSPRSPESSARDVVVARVHGQAFAQMWAELLANEGIASRMSPISGVVDNVYPTDTLYEVLVAAADAQRAREILPPQGTGETS